MIETLRSPSPQQLIDEWNSCEEVPDLPNINPKKCNTMDFVQEFDDLLDDLWEKPALIPNDYMRIRVLQQSLVLFLYNEQVTKHNILLGLQNLSNLCIWKYPKDQIIDVLVSSIMPQLPDICERKQNKANTNENIQSNSSSKESAKTHKINVISTKQQKFKTSNNKGQNNYQNQYKVLSNNNYDYEDPIQNDFSSEDYVKDDEPTSIETTNQYQNYEYDQNSDEIDTQNQFTHQQSKNQFTKQSKNQDSKQSKNQITKQSKNKYQDDFNQQMFIDDSEKIDFDSDAKNDFSIIQSQVSNQLPHKETHQEKTFQSSTSFYNDLIVIRSKDSKTDKIINHLKELLDVSNGIVSSDTTTKIRNQISELKNAYSSDMKTTYVLEQELDYLKRSTIPYQHVVYLRNLLFTNNQK